MKTHDESPNLPARLEDTGGNDPPAATNGDPIDALSLDPGPASLERSHPKFTPGQVIQAIRSTHGTIFAAARALRCTPKTIRRYVQLYPEVKAALIEARQMRLDLAELRLDAAVQNGEPWAVTFLLRTKGKRRGYTERIEHAGLDSGCTEIVVNLSKHLDVTADE